MTDKVFTLVHSFLERKDKTCAEIFKRSFEEKIGASDLPPLEDIVDLFLKSQRKAEKTVLEPIKDVDIKSLIQNYQAKSSDLLTRIVRKDKNENDSHDGSDSSSSDDILTDSSSDSDDIVQKSAPKRRKIAAGIQKVYEKSEDINGKKDVSKRKRSSKSSTKTSTKSATAQSSAAPKPKNSKK